MDKASKGFKAFIETAKGLLILWLLTSLAYCTFYRLHKKKRMPTQTKEATLMVPNRP